MSIYQVLRDELTDAQYAAAVDPAMEVLCLACAGSGKSTTLAYRIARLLAEGEQPDGIVAFTFTEKAAESIKRRVSQALLTAGLDPTMIGAMFIGTIHSYCQHVLGVINATYRQFDVLDENGLKIYLLSRYWEMELQSVAGRVKGRQFETIRMVSEAWNTANDELLDLNAIVGEDADIGNLLIQFRDKLYEDQYIDFSLMIRNVVEALRSDDTGAEAAVRQLRHLMCDEIKM